MSEEKIIYGVLSLMEALYNSMLHGTDCHLHLFNVPKYKEALQGLLDLYNKEKLNSLNLSEQLNKEKEKNKWKPISEYNREKYDWVLVKYFDGEYECVPEVAEQRGDGKWYTTEREIPFEVKYFFDMQKLLEE